jgi:hypothetical protein
MTTTPDRRTDVQRYRQNLEGEVDGAAPKPTFRVRLIGWLAAVWRGRGPAARAGGRGRR